MPPCGHASAGARTRGRSSPARHSRPRCPRSAAGSSSGSATRAARRRPSRRSAPPPLRGARTAAVTVSAASPIGILARDVAATGEVDRSWCHTVGYLSPILAAAAVGAAITGVGRDADPVAIRELLSAGAGRGSIAAEAVAHVDATEALARALARCRQLVVLASGADRTAARELALKVEEATWLPATMHDLETFLHGHIPATDEGTGLLLDPRRPGRPRGPLVARVPGARRGRAGRRPGRGHPRRRPGPRLARLPRPGRAGARAGGARAPGAGCRPRRDRDAAPAPGGADGPRPGDEPRLRSGATSSPTGRRPRSPSRAPAARSAVASARARALAALERTSAFGAPRPRSGAPVARSPGTSPALGAGRARRTPALAESGHPGRLGRRPDVTRCDARPARRADAVLDFRRNRAWARAPTPVDVPHEVTEAGSQQGEGRRETDGDGGMTAAGSGRGAAACGGVTAAGGPGGCDAPAAAPTRALHGQWPAGGTGPWPASGAHIRIDVCVRIDGTSSGRGSVSQQEAPGQDLPGR